MNVNLIPTLFAYSKWITLSNVIGPLLNFLDKIILSNVSGIAGAAYYIAASDFSQRLNIISGAIDRVVFPYFAKNKGSKDSWSYSLRISLITTMITFMPILIFSPWILEFWLGSEFGASSGLVVRILILAMMIFSVCVIPYSYIQSQGKSKLTAIIHIYEIPLYIGLLIFLVVNHGLIGAAFAVLIRSVLELFILFFLQKKLG